MERILFFALAGAALSCVSIDGGAVEAQWVVRSDDGRAITDCSCADPAIAAVRFTLVGDSGAVKGAEPCKGRAQCQFACGRQSGATPFDIPPGSYLISLTPVDATGQDLTVAAPGHPKVLGPAPVLREVVRGQPTQLDAFQLVAKCAATCAGADENKVCNRP
jgi:hypothetical protein